MIRTPLPRRPGPRVVLAVTIVATAVAVAGLAATVDVAALRDGLSAALGDPRGLTLALGAFGAAFLLRALAWQRTLPGLGLGHSVAAIHATLGANHLLPLRLGEPVRILYVVRRAGVDPADATASTVLLRTADLLSLMLLGLVAGPAVVSDLLGPAGGIAAVLLCAVAAVTTVVVVRRRRAGSTMQLPGPVVLLLTTAAWSLEAVLVWQVLQWFQVSLSPTDALVVLAAAVGAQLVAIAPGGLGTYEAAATAGLVAVGVPAGGAAAAALAMHALKTVYSLATGAAAVVWPAPPLWGRVRLPAVQRPRPSQAPGLTPGPVVLFMPAYDEGPRIAACVERTPAHVAGRPVEVLVIDDGSSDDTVAQAQRAGARVIRHDRNRGLGAAVRTGLAEATAMGASAVAFCDADGEYDPAALADLVTPILQGRADYVVGSRFTGTIRHMRPHRRLGNQVLTAWVRWTVRHPVTDGQSGYRAFSPAAASHARIPHDYNYAQVLTIDLLEQGFVYDEVGIDYRFRESGQSFIRLGRYLSRVLPTVWRQLNPPRSRLQVR